MITVWPTFYCHLTGSEEVALLQSSICLLFLFIHLCCNMTKLRWRFQTQTKQFVNKSRSLLKITSTKVMKVCCSAWSWNLNFPLLHLVQFNLLLLVKHFIFWVHSLPGTHKKWCLDSRTLVQSLFSFCLPYSHVWFGSGSQWYSQGI